MIDKDPGQIGLSMGPLPKDENVRRDSKERFCRKLCSCCISGEIAFKECLEKAFSRPRQAVTWSV